MTLGAAVSLLLFFILGFVLYAALFAAIGAMVSNEQDAQQAATPVTILIVMSAVFIQPVMLNPTSTTNKIISWIPFSAPSSSGETSTSLAVVGSDVVLWGSWSSVVACGSRRASTASASSCTASARRW